mgnify:CR=1 FL=1
MIKVKRKKHRRLCQGDILHDVEYVESVIEDKGIIEVSKIVFPLVIVLSQDCDLEQDYRSRSSNQHEPSLQDKWLLSVLVAPLYNLEHVLQGEHLSELNYRMQQFNRKRTEGKYLVSNQRPRYHYLEFPSQIPIPPSVIDFKHYFAANVLYLRRLKRSNFVCGVATPYREDIAQRFASFLARIGLPAVRDTQTPD